MKVYHFLSEKYCLQSLCEQRLKVSSLHDLNDPFELLSIDFSDKTLRPIFKQIKKNISDKVGMICFSNNWTEPLLWSHYADKHKGCALEFNIDDSNLVEVKYQYNRVYIPKESVLINNLDEFELKLMSTKYESWKYEDEIRIFHKKNNLIKSENLFFLNFSSDFHPSSIITGSLSKLTVASIKNNLPAFSKIKLIRSRLAFKSFKIVRNKSISSRIIIGNG